MNQVITIVTKDKLSTLKKTITTISNIINEDGKVQKYVSLSLSAMDIMFICEKKSINKIKRNIYKYLKNYPVDFYIQNQTNRKKKLLACDMDMTILTFESINRMANKAGIYKNIEKETKKAVSGKSNFSDSIIKRTKMFKGYHKDICLKIFENKNCFTPGSKILINSSINIAQVFGVSERFIGLSLVAIGTSLPELTTAIIASLKKLNDIAIGNVLGANTYNLLGILSIVEIIEPSSILKYIENIDIYYLMISTFLLIFFIKKVKLLNRGAGFIFLLSYISYIYLVY